MDTQSLLSIKKLNECLILEENILNSIKLKFKESNIKYVKKNKNKCNILKDSNYNLKKNMINNKIIFILNKLSEINIDKIIKEFIQNIKLDCIENFNIFQDIIFQKILKEEKFVDIYCDLFVKIVKYTFNKYNYEPNIIFKIIDEYIKNYLEKNESERLLFLKFLSVMENKKFFKISIVNYISNILINLKCIPGIKFWYLHYNLDKDNIKNFEIKNVREKLLYESIFDKKTGNIKADKKINKKLNIKSNINLFDNQCENIIEEYNYIKINNEIKYFIDNNCDSLEKKKYFFNYLLKYYINNNTDNILELINYIINIKIIDLKLIKSILNKYNNSNNLINKILL